MSSGRTKRAGHTRVPRGTLNQVVILTAAIAVIDTDGLPALTIGRLAQDLGVRPMSLYTHFRDKDAILQAVATALFERFEMPADAPSDIELLRKMMRAYFRLLVDNPALMVLSSSVDTVSPAEARFSDSLYGCLQRMRVDHHAAVGLVATMLRFVIGCATVYPVRRTWDEDPEHWERERQRLAQLPPEVYPSMHDLARDFPTFTQLEVFEYGLQTLLDAVTAAADTVA